jgi:hypothetical protein|tara:strand:- start:601 stop:795 length:195 start_codon:yes stop_codon:yes gene_type:complete
MNPREKVLGVGNLYLQRGEPIPLDVLAEADRLGLSLTDFDQPSTNYNDANYQEGEFLNGTEEDI